MCALHLSTTSWAALVGTVTLTSLRSIRRRMSYETWYLIHLLAYGGLALSFMHEITLGGDFADFRYVRWGWTALHVVVLTVVLTVVLSGRWGRLIAACAHPLRVTARREVGPETVELTFNGRGLRRLVGDAGQFVMVRPMVAGLWWQSHPFSLSAAPKADGLRITVTSRGDASAAITALDIGTLVAVEGPYGACTPETLGGRKALFVVGGVGVAPVRAMLERLSPDHEPVVLYRAHRQSDLIHLDELRMMTARLGGRLHTLVGPTAALAVKDPFSPKVLRAAVPDLGDRTAVLCGPERLLHAARAGLIDAGVPVNRIHFERPWW